MKDLKFSLYYWLQIFNINMTIEMAIAYEESESKLDSDSEWKSYLLHFDNPNENNSNQGNSEGNLPGQGNPESNIPGQANVQGNIPGQANVQGNNDNQPHQENPLDDEDDGYKTDSNRSFFEEGADAMTDYPVRDLPDDHLRRFAKDTAKVCRDPWRAGIGGEENQRYQDKWQERHEELRGEIRRRKDEGTLPDSPSVDYDAISLSSSENEEQNASNKPESTDNPAAPWGPGPSNYPGSLDNPSAAPSGAGPSNYPRNSSNPSAPTSGVEPSTSSVEPSTSNNPSNPSAETSAVEPSTRHSWWSTVFSVEGGSSSNTDRNINPQDPNTNTNEIELEKGESSANTSDKRKLEKEEEGESSTQPSKKFKQDSSDIAGDTEPFDIGGGDD